MSIDLRAVAPEECIACRAIREVVEHHGSGTCTAAVNGAELAYFLGILHGTACLATKTELRLCRAHAGELLIVATCLTGFGVLDGSGSGDGYG